MDVTALHANISDPTHLTTEDRLEELLQTLPLPRPTAPEETRQLPVALETVVEAIHDHADSATTPDRDQELTARGHRHRPARATHHTAIIARHHLPDFDLAGRAVVVSSAVCGWSLLRRDVGGQPGEAGRGVAHPVRGDLAVRYQGGVASNRTVVPVPGVRDGGIGMRSAVGTPCS
jgi:hypothetical protein